MAKVVSSGAWIDSFPYDTDYCDHFETPRQAYDDIAPILDMLLLSTQKPSRSKITIYDPYFCDGRAGRMLRELGFQVQHDKRDFYKDIQNGNIPHHDILVTNPPFSDQHKKVNYMRKLLYFCLASLTIASWPSFYRGALNSASSNSEAPQSAHLRYSCPTTSQRESITRSFLHNRVIEKMSFILFRRQRIIMTIPMERVKTLRRLRVCGSLVST